ncbi:hypothetical protein [Gracilibacillus thailandensis]|uniref:Uncharacterized protein n=1 Tax=Gracilibacillus thailandensis TaxID=563735 RepID=A0A6N7QUW5_9BACI|nr:hypothetical protein [Gracilibacillus thailandensis]MRI65344.1 hypothetical protein [Gracilibacillus thailandensis]
MFLPLKNHVYKVIAQVGGWQKEITVESNTELSRNQIADKALKEIDEKEAILIGFKKVTY